MNLNQKIFLNGLTILLLGCGAKVMPPLYEKPPSLPETPEISIVDQLDAPRKKQLVLSLNLFEKNLPNKDNYVNSPGAKKNGEERPSVIIAVPAEVSGKQKLFEKNKDEESIFGTSGYYNEAEQYVEQSLLRNGFSVLDRSKFEAKLRDLRDKAEYGKSIWWDSYTKKALENGEYDVVKTDLKNKYSQGKLTLIEYTKQVDAVNKHSQRALPGKKRSENEMNDIAEVIRAAQTGADRAGYLLQINEVKIGKAENVNLSIQNKPEVLSFIKEHKGLNYGELPYSLPAQISSKWFRSSLNAKLISIKTGSIAWLGNHEIQSWNAEKVNITFNITKTVSNINEVNGKIITHNKSLRNKKSRFNDAKKELLDLYNISLNKRKFENKSDLEINKKYTINKIKDLENELTTLKSDINSLNTNPPIFSENPWKFKYYIQPAIIKPDLINISNKTQQNKLKNHKGQLIKEVCKNLINTIKIE